MEPLRRRIGLFTAIVALALLTRLPFLLTADCINSDACVVPLMARHFAQGEFTPYFWGQRYMAAFEPLLLTPLAFFGLATALASVVVSFLIVLVQLYQVTRLARLVGAPVAVSALLFAVQAAVPASHQMALWGARHASTCLGLWALERALSGKLANGRGALATGAILGLAFFGDHLTVVFLLPVLYAAWQRRTHLRLVSGVFPWRLLDAILSTTSAAGRHSLPQDPRDWLRGVRLLTTSALPRVLGMEWLDPSVRVQPGVLWVLLSLCGALALACVAWFAYRELAARDPALLGVRLLAATLLLAGICHAIGALDEESARYLLLGFAPFAVLVAWLAARRGPLIGALLVIGVLAPRLPSLYRMQGAYAGRGAYCRQELAQMIGAVDRLGARAVFADYWDAYRLALASNERWPVGLALRANRHPCWNHWARAATPVAYLAPSSRHPIYEKLERAVPGVRFEEIGSRRIALVPGAVAGLDGPEGREPPAACRR
ncbi:MAG TPA: hypothetical protein VGK73_03325 [Polyangiaceae bacterium]